MNFRSAFNEVFRVEIPIAVLVFAIVCGLILFAVIRYRAGRGHEPSAKSEHPVGEPAYVVLTILIAFGLATFVYTINTRERTLPPGKPALRVLITGFQWCWRFHYEGTPVTVSGTCMTKAQTPTLVVPTNENLRFLLTSADVIHEWWVPYFRWKIEAFPDHTQMFDMTITHPGNWVGRCTVFCGIFHYRMDFRVKAVPPGQFHAFLASHASNSAAAA